MGNLSSYSDGLKVDMADDDLAMCYQCGQICEQSTYCHSCYDQRCQSDFRNEQKWQHSELNIQKLELDLEHERAKYRRLEAALSSYRTMLLHGIHADITIETGNGDKTPAHRAVLASRSPVFNAMFEHELKEKTCAIIRVDDVPTPAMRALLLYIYTGEHDTTVMKEHGMALLAAAHKYDIPDLKRICESSVSVHPSNALDILQQAKLYDANTLKRVCIESIASNIKQVAWTDGFRQLVFRNEDPEALLDIIQCVANAL